MKILIIKLGSIGDVLRTTPILRALDGNITWVMRERSAPLFKNNKFVHRVIRIEDLEDVDNRNFDMVLSLDEDHEACELASRVKCGKLIGVFMDRGKIAYTESSSGWFNMSAISRLGICEADRLKKANRKSYQEILFEMIGMAFNGEEYVFDPPFIKSPTETIGLEARVGEKWPTKRWGGFIRLAEDLLKKGHPVKFLKQEKSIVEYAAEINSCGLLITGDTLAMHLGIALKKDTIALFGPTSPAEIFDYGRMRKIAASMDCACCYKSKCYKKPTCMELISPQQVFNEIKMDNLPLSLDHLKISIEAGHAPY